MLTLQHLSRQCNGHRFFDSTGVTLLPGCLLQLQGPSGSGKTLLLQLIAGVQSCPKGSVTFAQQETRGDKEFFADTLYLPDMQQDLALRRTVEKQLKAWARKGEPSLIPAAIHYFALAPWLKTPLKDLSAGWKQRVRLARLMLQPAALWLLDRPFYALDEAGRMQLEHLIAGRCKQNGIVIFTHDGETHLNPHHRLELP